MPTAQGIRAGAAYIELYAKDNRLVRGLSKASKRLKAFGASVQTLGAKTLAVGGLLAGPLGLTVKAASDMEETMNKFNVVFGDSADEVKSWGDSLAAEVGRSKQQVADFLAGTQDLLVPIGFAPGAATDLSKQLTRLAIDLASFNNKADSDVIRDLHAALTGSSEVMKKYGVIVNETAVKQELLSQGIDKTNASELQKVMARLAIIMRGTTAAQGDAVRSAGSFANQMKALRASVDDAAVEIGTALLPVVTPLVTQLANVARIVGQWAKENQTLIATVLKIAAGVAIAGAGLLVLGTLISGFGSLLGVVVAVIAKVGAGIAALGSMVALLVSPLGLVVAAATALAAVLIYTSGAGGKALGWLADRFRGFSASAIQSWEGVRDALVAGDISLAARILWLSLKVQWQKGVAHLEKLWLGFKRSFIEITQGIIFGAAQIMVSGWALIERGWVETTAFLADAWTVFTSMLTKTWFSAVGFIQKAWVRLKGLFDEDIDVEAEVSRINQQTQAKQDIADDLMLGQISSSDRRRRQRLTEIDQQAGDTNANLAQMHAEQSGASDARYAEQLADSEARLAEARSQWQEAIAKAKEARQKVETESGSQGLEALQSSFLASGDELAGTQKATAKGTFSAFGVRGLGADSLAERTAKATEDVVRNTKELVDRAKQGRLVFAE